MLFTCDRTVNIVLGRRALLEFRWGFPIDVSHWESPLRKKV
jgi:hypothetical protein